ncbi:MAG TPA: adenylate/guanylate cyclase domain-containing protein [Alphaproteobacteria bacterium]|nr:adenylate/guanylate cyclase domain-containing protein [Alphaproteobacteria bacterium]
MTAENEIKEPRRRRSLTSLAGALRLGAGRAGLPERSPGNIPERVEAAIHQQQDASERLIGWIQLSVVVTFGTLYILSPKTFTAQAEIVPVPYALAAYLMFTVLRLVLAYRGRLADWFLTVSVVADMALLLGLIWSFHIQYNQPPSFYLKAPTLLYVFIFIALRALRFEARYVLLAGFVSALGWGFLIAYVIYSQPEDPMITRNYVTYLTSNSILLGAEFDKIVSILVVTGILALAIFRARRLLVRSVVEQAAARDLSRFFAPEIAERIKASDHVIQAGEGEARDAAILNTDIRGFTKYAEAVPARTVIELLTEYQSRVVPVIRKHGGSVDKFLGDGILATFGAAAPSETYAADALRAADEVIAVTDAWAAERVSAGETPLVVGASVAAGRVVFGAIGDEERLEYTVIGDPVNLAAKLDKHSKVEKCRGLTTVETLTLAEAQGYVPPAERKVRPRRTVDGVATPIDVVPLG